MTYTPIPKGTQDWDVPLNAALALLDADIANVTSDSLQAANNLSDLTNAAQARTNLGIAASAAADQVIFNVKDHNAVGNGIADDTSAIQYTLSLASGNGGGIVYFPPGTYKISTVLTTYSKVTILGAGPNATIINQVTTTAGGITGVDLSFPAIKELTLNGPNTGSTVGINFTLSSNAATVFPTIENVYVKDFGSHGIAVQNSIVGTYSKVISESNGGNGFHIVGQTFPAAAGTSSNFDACYANANGANGFNFYNMVYCSLNSCAADGNATTAYLFDTCQSISALGCGAESQTTDSFKITGGFGVGLYDCWIYQNNGRGIWVTGSANSVVLSGCTDNTPAGGATNFIKVDSGSHVAMTMCHNTTANSLASGTTNVLDDTAGGVVFNGYAFLANQLEVVGNITSDTGNIIAGAAGKGLNVAEGSNARMGTTTLNGATDVVVNTTAVTANSRILLTIQAQGAGTTGSPFVRTRTAGTSFTIRSTGAGDTSTVAWLIVEPA